MPYRMPVTGNTEKSEPENRAFFPSLDGVRALAFLMVVEQHYLALPWGWSGVDIFFVLSGFLITGILFDSRDDLYRVRNFYLRRSLRIFPLYYGVFLVLLLTTPLMHWRWTWSWLAWPLYLGNYLRFLHPYTYGSPWAVVADAQIGGTRFPQYRLFLGHFWSLCVEEQFYLFWPWVVFFVRSRRALLWICAACVVLVPLARAWGDSALSANMLKAEILYRVTPFRLDALLLGGLAALWYRGSQRDLMLRAASWVFWFCTAAVAIYLAQGILHNTFYVAPSWQLTWGLSFIDLYALSLLLVTIQPGTWLYRIFGWRPLRWLGRISYGAYVFHDMLDMPIKKFTEGVVTPHIHSHFGGNLTGFLMALSFSCVTAWLSFRFFESRFLNLKDRWTVRGVRVSPELRESVSAG